MTVWLFVAVVVGVVGHCFFQALRSRWEISVLIQDGRCQFRKGVPPRDQETYESFFVRDLEVEGRVEIFARTSPNGRLVIKTRGPLDSGQKQRLRNFLLHGTT